MPNLNIDSFNVKGLADEKTRKEVSKGTTI